MSFQGPAAHKRLIKLSVFLLLVCAAIVLTPKPARAQVDNLASCMVGTHTANWSPGLTNTVQTINVSTTSHWTACGSLAYPLAVSASSTQNFQATFSCQSLLLQTPPINWVINWIDGASSTYEFTASVTSTGNLNTTITGVGKIVSGRYKDAKALTTFVLQDVANILNNDCNQPEGVTRMSGITTLLISP